MATAEKHMKRSRRSYHDVVPKQMFTFKAMVRKQKKEQRDMFKNITPAAEA